MRLLQLVILLMLTVLGHSVSAADLIITRAYVDDPAGRMTLDEVKNQPSLPFQGVLSRGFTPSATWLKLTVSGLSDVQPGDKLVVRIRPTYLDDIEIHDPLDNSGRTRQSGDHYDWHDAEFKSLNHGFVIPASAQPRDIWLRLKTTSSSFIHVDVLTRTMPSKPTVFRKCSMV